MTDSLARGGALADLTVAVRLDAAPLLRRARIARAVAPTCADGRALRALGAWVADAPLTLTVSGEPTTFRLADPFDA
ncbi:MAG: hypothetical protein PHS14_18075 [Elusimicrobia bacterium]|nr:hypothetical protein [Elusimicrobiota bacterium]